MSTLKNDRHSLIQWTLKECVYRIKHPKVPFCLLCLRLHALTLPMSKSEPRGHGLQPDHKPMLLQLGQQSGAVGHPR